MSTSSRKQCHGAEPCDIRTLGDALYHVVHHSGRPARELAELLSVRYSYLLDASNPDRDEVQFQARLIAPLTQISGDTAVIDYLARACDGVFVPTPRLSAEHGDIAQSTAAILREVADVIQAPAQALAGDNTINAQECAAVEREIDQAIVALLQLKDVVRQKAGVERDQRPFIREAVRR